MPLIILAKVRFAHTENQYKYFGFAVSDFPPLYTRMESDVQGRIFLVQKEESRRFWTSDCACADEESGGHALTMLAHSARSIFSRKDANTRNPQTDENAQSMFDDDITVGKTDRSSSSQHHTSSGPSQVRAPCFQPLSVRPHPLQPKMMDKWANPRKENLL